MIHESAGIVTNHVVAAVMRVDGLIGNCRMIVIVITYGLQYV
jgi:hypothetical protein